MSFTGNIRKTPFSILIATQREMHQSKKLYVKNLSRPHTKRTHQSFHLWVCHLGMLWTQTEESNSVFQTSPIIIIVGQPVFTLVPSCMWGRVWKVSFFQELWVEVEEALLAWAAGLHSSHSHRSSNTHRRSTAVRYPGMITIQIQFVCYSQLTVSWSYQALPQYLMVFSVAKYIASLGTQYESRSRSVKGDISLPKAHHLG